MILEVVGCICLAKEQWEVIEGKTSFPLNLDINVISCMCGWWQMTGIFCKHAYRVINNNRLNPSPFVSSYYTVATYKATYELNIAPMTNPSQWVPTDVPNWTTQGEKGLLAYHLEIERGSLMSKGRGKCMSLLGVPSAMSLDITKVVAWEA